MNRLKNTGLVLCGLVLGLSLSAPAAQAVESLKATLSTNRVLVDGQEVRLTAYTIGGSNYVRLRDIGKAVGFEVYWDSNAKCVQVRSGIPYTGEEPAKDEVIKPAPQPEPTVPANDADVDSVKVSTGPAQGKMGAQIRPCKQLVLQGQSIFNQS